MSICNECLKPKAIARCLTNIIVGTISSVNTDVYVFIKNLTTERVVMYSVTSSGAGLITVPITPQKFSEDHAYEIYITKQSAVNINAKENITINGEVSNCVNLRFSNILESDNDQSTFPNQTLTI